MGKVNAQWMDEYSDMDMDSWDVTGEAAAQNAQEIHQAHSDCAGLLDANNFCEICGMSVEPLGRGAPVEAVPMVREMKVRTK